MSDLDIRNKEDLINGYIIAENVVNKNYLRTLSNYEVLEITDKLDDISLKNTVSMFKIKQIVHKKEEDIHQKLSTIYNSVASNGSSIIMIIDSKKDGLDIYIGVKSANERKYLRSAAKTMTKGMDGNFDGSILEEFGNAKLESLISSIFGDDTKIPITVSAVSGVATIRNKEKTENKKFIQGIEKFIDSMQGSIYTAIFIADSLNAEDINNVRNGYEQLYSTISPFVKSNYTYNESDSISVAESISKGMVESVTKGTSFTQNHTISKTEGIFSANTFSGNLGLGIGSNTTTNIGNNIGSTRASIGGPIGGMIGGIVGTAIAGPIGGAVLSTVLGSLSGNISTSTGESTSVSNGNSLGGNLGVGYAHTSGKNTSESVSDGTSEGSSESVTKGINTQQSTSTTDTKSNGRMLQLEFTDKKASNLIEKIDLQLKRLKESEDFGMFNCSVYMLSADKQTSVIAANTYKALMIGEESSVETSVVNTWDETEEMQKYLRKFMHPIFEVKISEEVSIPYTAGSIVSGLELPLHIGFPQKSVSGIPVIEYAEFGRNILTYDNIYNDKFNLGHIYHMGKQSNTEVNLDTRSMTMHTFITGSTGSGKSNAIYKILDELDKKEVKFLVIEPAKGEYKNIFANKNVCVYGTNPKKTKLLRINPFSFTDDIHVLEHIDRLIEVFNACWPMYAAMPAVLKASVEQAYIQAGWDLEISENKYSEDLFPTFGDVLNQIYEVVNKSEYSQDSKSDYIGALTTRVKELSEGINGQIFTQNSLPENKLFDENVIIDLSRIGSMQTKSLIMGMLIIKLQEYRMSNNCKNNNELKHVTVLEEAHNLLKRTSTEQVTESANLIGKSVEMLANSIAEMRTYGEGFIIADQAPGLLDMSVIRNTNTKIILRLPDFSDRELVGKSAGLNDEQIKELTKLKCGVAAVYQNNWIEPVLCNIDEFESEASEFLEKDTDLNFNNKLKKELTEILLAMQVNEKLDYDINKLEYNLIRSNYDLKLKLVIINLLKENNRLQINDVYGIISQMYRKNDIYESSMKAKDFDDWNKRILDNINPIVNELSNKYKNAVLQCILKEEALTSDKKKEFYFNWCEHMRGKAL